MIYREAMGSSLEDAIEIENSTKNNNGEIIAEIEHLEMMFGKPDNWQKTGNKHFEINNKHYDEIEITLVNGDKMKVFFDVTTIQGE